MSRLYHILLGLSLSLNVFFSIKFYTPLTTEATAPYYSKSSGVGIADVGNPPPLNSPPSHYYSNNDNLLNYLKSSNTPDYIIRAVAVAMVHHQSSEKKKEILTEYSGPKWKKSKRIITPEQTAALNKLRTWEQDEIRRLSDTDITSGMAASMGIAAERQPAVDRILADYSTLRSQAIVEHRSKSLPVEKLLEDNLLADMQETLNESEYDDFLHFYSPEAARTQRRLGNLDLDDIQYREIFDSINSLKNGEGALAERNYAYLLEEAKMLQEKFSPEVAAAVARSSNADFRNVANTLSSIGLNDEQIATAYIEYNEYIIRDRTESTSPNGTFDSTREQAQKNYENLTKGLTDEQIQRLIQLPYVKSLIKMAQPKP